MKEPIAFSNLRRRPRCLQGLVGELKARDKTIDELKAKSAEVDALKAKLEAV